MGLHGGNRELRALELWSPGGYNCLCLGLVVQSLGSTKPYLNPPKVGKIMAQNL